MKTSLLYFIKCFPIPNAFHHPGNPIDRHHFCCRVAMKEMETQGSQVLCSRSYKELGPNCTYSKFISFPECHSLPFYLSHSPCNGKTVRPSEGSFSIWVCVSSWSFSTSVSELQPFPCSMPHFVLAALVVGCFCFCFFVHQHPFLGLLKEINCSRIKVLAPKSDIG